MQNPIFVRQNQHISCSYLIVDGERRWRACKDLNYATINCRVITSDYDGYQIVALAQNLHRDDLLPIEKANAFTSLLARLQGSDENAKQKALMNFVNLSENYISEILKISRLDGQIKEEALKSKKWSANKLLQLAKIKNDEHRLSRFEEYKAVINKTPKLPTKESSFPESLSEPQSPDTESSNQDKIITRLFSLSSAFIKHLENSATIKLIDSQKIQFKSRLTTIQDLFNQILS